MELMSDRSGRCGCARTGWYGSVNPRLFLLHGVLNAGGIRRSTHCSLSTPWSAVVKNWHSTTPTRTPTPTSTPKTLSYGVKIANIAHGLCFAYDTTLVVMATSLEESEKLDRIEKTNANTFHLVKNIVKIGPVDTDIALLIVKKKKLRKVKYIARSAT